MQFVSEQSPLFFAVPNQCNAFRECCRVLRAVVRCDFHRSGWIMLIVNTPDSVMSSRNPFPGRSVPNRDGTPLQSVLILRFSAPKGRGNAISGLVQAIDGASAESGIGQLFGMFERQRRSVASAPPHQQRDQAQLDRRRQSRRRRLLRALQRRYRQRFSLS
jgi:hypothetical protein